jgi:hypothetical protein
MMNGLECKSDRTTEGLGRESWLVLIYSSPSLIIVL